MSRLHELFHWYKKRNSGYSAIEKIQALMTLIISGGEHIADIEQLRNDPGLKKICGISGFPAQSVLSDFLNSMKKSCTRAYYSYNIKEAVGYYKKNRIQNIVLDIDSVLCENNKKISSYSYKKYKAFNPLFITDEEHSLFLAGIFRNGNASPQADILTIFKNVYRAIKKLNYDIGITVRMDSAGYQKEIIDYFTAQGIEYTITGDNFSSKLEQCQAIPEKQWEKYDDMYEIAKEYSLIESKGKQTNIIMIIKRKEKKEPDLFGKYTYTYFISNKTLMTNKELTAFHAHRGNAENKFKELKADYWLNNFPCHTIAGNEFFMQIMIHVYNMLRVIKESLFGTNWIQHTLRTMQNRVIRIAGYVIRHSREITIKVNKQYIYYDTLHRAYDTSQYIIQ
jgi:hypothetical protein